MYQIIQVTENEVMLGTEDDRIVKVPRICLNFDDPVIGDRVRAFRDEGSVIIAREAPVDPLPQERSIIPQQVDDGPQQIDDGPQQSRQAYDTLPQIPREPEQDRQEQNQGSFGQSQDSSGQRQAWQDQQFEYNQAYRFAADEKRINKHIFVWVCNFLFGNWGVDRFIRGQIGFGILKIITCGAFGVWTIIDFIISLVKAYGDAYGNEEDIIFVNGKYLM